mmetsp:Transcript_16118/g.38872  ORF Transcript_16118/g.38872 Transcript_16118/m.38872 type:complete len:252 (-) Transcript_16118:146-901(-)
MLVPHWFPSLTPSSTTCGTSGELGLSSMEAGGRERAAWAATPSPSRTRKATSSSSKCAESVKESSAASSVERVRCCSGEHAAVDTTCTRAAFSPGGHSCSAQSAWSSDPAACRCGDSPKSIRRWSRRLMWRSLALIAARSNVSESPAKWSESSRTRGLFITFSGREYRPPSATPDSVERVLGESSADLSALDRRSIVKESSLDARLAFSLQSMSSCIWRNHSGPLPRRFIVSQPPGSPDGIPAIPPPKRLP